jgi:hypothetical protein
MFFFLFLLDDRRIRIQETQKHMDPTDTDLDSDPDPQHCLPVKKCDLGARAGSCYNGAATSGYHCTSAVFLESQDILSAWCKKILCYFDMESFYTKISSHPRSTSTAAF